MVDNAERSRRLVEARFGRVWERNFRANVHAMIRDGGIGPLSALAAGRVHVLAGAGPSLDAEVHLLPELRRRGAYIVAADAVLQRLAVEEGIVPDVVFCVDPQPEMAVFFAGVQAPGCVLAACSVSHPAVAATWGGPTVWWHQDNLLIPTLARLKAAFPLPALPVGGNVMTAALSFSRLAGASSVVMLGMDCMFSGDRTHCRGVPFADAVYRNTGDQRPYGERPGAKTYLRDHMWGLVSATDVHGWARRIPFPFDYSRAWTEAAISGMADDGREPVNASGGVIVGGRRMVAAQFIHFDGEEKR